MHWPARCSVPSALWVRSKRWAKKQGQRAPQSVALERDGAGKQARSHRAGGIMVMAGFVPAVRFQLERSI
jgi:hypothetical protein